jgi:hypothetical protein
MTEATSTAKQADRTESRLLRSLFERLNRYMARAGLIAFVADPAAPAGDAPTLLGGDTPAAGAGADGKPAADAKPAEGADGKPAADAKPGDTPVLGADGKPVEAKPDAKPDDKPAGAPEKYEDFKLPDTLKADAPFMGKFAEWAKANNLSQEAAQSAVDLVAEMQTGTVAGLQTALEAQSTQWAEASKADKEFGGDKFDENLAVGKKALDTFGTPELKALLTQSKFGNHPEVLRFFVRAGKAISQDGFAPGRSGAGQASDATRIYSNSKMNP